MRVPVEPYGGEDRPEQADLLYRTGYSCILASSTGTHALSLRGLREPNETDTMTAHYCTITTVSVYGKLQGGRICY